MSPKFKFPDWVTKKNTANKAISSYQKDLNKAEAKDIHKGYRFRV